MPRSVPIHRVYDDSDDKIDLYYPTRRLRDSAENMLRRGGYDNVKSETFKVELTRRGICNALRQASGLTAITRQEINDESE